MKNILKLNEYFDLLYSYEDLSKWVTIVLENFGYRDAPVNLIVSGGNGNVFLTPDNKVLKITKDRNEALNTQYLINLNKELKNFAKYYEVKAITFENPKDNKIKTFDQQAPIYALMMEHLNTELKYKNLINSIIRFFECYHRKLKEYIKHFCNYNIESYNDFLYKNSIDRFQKHFQDDTNALSFYKFFIDLMKEAKDNRIIIGDMNVDNLAYNQKGNLVIFDLGGMSNKPDNYENLLSDVDLIRIPNLELI